MDGRQERLHEDAMLAAAAIQQSHRRHPQQVPLDLFGVPTFTPFPD
jgi:hypothetical protein